jgi:hypothetical protein
MKKYIFFIITALGLGLLSSCEKDETQAVLSSNPTIQTLNAPSTLVLSRADASKSIMFSGKAADFGFEAAIKYTLEGALATDTAFKNVITIASAEVDTFALTTADLNSLLLTKGLTEDAVNNLILRVKAYVSDAVVTYSKVSKIAVTPYGLPRLDLMSSGNVINKITSAKGDGVYSSYVKLAADASFTLKDPDTGKEYGLTAGNVAVGGAALTTANATTKDASETAGWYILTVDVNTGKFSLDAYMIGLVGTATPNGWNAPDLKMEYDVKTGIWSATADLAAGFFKFRLNNAWDWNLGGTLDNLTHGGADIAVTAGKYLIKLEVTNAAAGTETGKYTIEKAQ